MKKESGSWLVPAIVGLVILALLIWWTVSLLSGGISVGGVIVLIITVAVGIDLLADAGKVLKG